ncbi:MAG TPA: DUF4097 family beta strand repeat-containing protein [Ktedonobacteraceae bacterium]
MSDQEMQFADPDWKPTRPLDKNKAQQEQEVYTPQPINVESQEQQKWQSSVPLSDYQEGYSGSDPQIPPAEKIGYPGPGSYRDTAPNSIGGGQFGQPQARRRGRRPWFWIIIALIILGLMSGGFGSVFPRKGNPIDRGFGFPQKAFTETRTFATGTQPTIVINDASGDVQVHTADASSVTVQATKQTDGFGNPNNEQVSYIPSPDGNTLTINTNGGSGSVNFDVAVPSTSNLKLVTSSGNITVDGINGQISMSTGSGAVTATNDIFTGSATLSTGSGDITAKQDQLNGPATLQTGSGNITFDGGITGSGDYQFTTGSGDIDASFNSSTALDINASTDNGSITSNVQSVPAQNNDPGGTANGYIGSPHNSIKLTLKTGDGSINLNSTP